MDKLKQHWVGCMQDGDVTESDGLRYYASGTQLVVSVTSVLGWVFGYGGWFGYRPGDPAILTARRRGSAVHAASAILAQELPLDWPTVHHLVMPFVAQFADFKKHTGWRASEIEMRVVSKKHGYGGRLDQVGSWPPHTSASRGLLDLKTTQDIWLGGYQTAAYESAYRETIGHTCGPLQRAILVLDGGKPDGWRLRELDRRDDMTVFLSALNVFKAADQAGRLRRPCPACGEVRG